MTSIDEVLQECHANDDVVSVDNLCFDNFRVTGFIVHMMTSTRDEYFEEYEWDGERYLFLNCDAEE